MKAVSAGAEMLDSPVASIEGEGKVEHLRLEDGTVLDVDRVKKAHIVLFDDMDTPRAISFRAKLEKI